ncbi:MAG: hypothetical protein IJO87_02025 [Eggerthellaceae bacterium]|nr:hypothetical protein [Eggerthellaceae bacterium]
MERYYGGYHKFDALSEKEAGYLLNADNLVGDRFVVTTEFVDGIRVAWLENKFGKRIGFFDEDFSRQISLFEARGWEIYALLSYIAYTETEQGGLYWGEMAIISCEPQITESVSPLIDWLSKRLGEGVRPRIDFDTRAVEKLLSSSGAWRPEQNMPAPNRGDGTVIMKDSLSLGDKVIEKGRQGNIGCYALSWCFLIALVIGILFLVKTVLGL